MHDKKRNSERRKSHELGLVDEPAQATHLTLASHSSHAARRDACDAMKKAGMLTNAYTLMTVSNHLTRSSRRIMDRGPSPTTDPPHLEWARQGRGQVTVHTQLRQTKEGRALQAHTHTHMHTHFQVSRLLVIPPNCPASRERCLFEKKRWLSFPAPPEGSQSTDCVVVPLRRHQQCKMWSMRPITMRTGVHLGSKSSNGGPPHLELAAKPITVIKWPLPAARRGHIGLSCQSDAVSAQPWSPGCRRLPAAFPGRMSPSVRLLDESRCARDT